MKNEAEILNEIANWTVFETDTGDVYRETTREELDDLCARGYRDLCCVSAKNYAKALNGYIPGAEYEPNTKYYRVILSAWSRQYNDWKMDYVRIRLISEDESDERTNYFILRDFDGYGNTQPVCVDRAEAEELMRGWYATDANAPAFNDVWREASSDEIEKYGISKS